MSRSGFTNKLENTRAAIVAEPCVAFPNPPVDAGCVTPSSWGGDYGCPAEIEITITAGADVELAAGAFICARESLTSYAEESEPVTLTNATEIVNYTAHGFYTGDGPIRLSGTLPAQLSDATPYWVIRVDADDFKLAASRALALAGTVVAFGSDGADVVVHWTDGTKSTSQNASAITDVGDTYTIEGHGLATGDRVQVANSGGALPTGLTADTDYYVIVVDEDTIQFAANAVNAEAGTEITWTGGSGTQSVISNAGLTAAAATIYSKFHVINSGSAIDLTADIGYRERIANRPGVLSYHIVGEVDVPAPVTLQIRPIAYKE